MRRKKHPERLLKRSGCFFSYDYQSIIISGSSLQNELQIIIEKIGYLFKAEVISCMSCKVKLPSNCITVNSFSVLAIIINSLITSPFFLA